MQEPEPSSPDKSESDDNRAVLAEEESLRKARALSEKWGDRLDEFDLPCPLCRGVLVFHGMTRDRLYEFAEAEPGAVEPLDIFPLTFVCNRCGYAAEFDAELFNPAHLAALAGAGQEQVAELAVRRFRALVPLRSGENSETLLDLATAIAGERTGEVVVLDADESEAQTARLEEALERYRPAAGDPAPVAVVRKGPHPLWEAVPEAVRRQHADLLLLQARGRARAEETALVRTVNAVLSEALCDVALVYDRGLAGVNRILFATSGGPSARAAAPLALDAARAFDAELHMLYVASPHEAEPEEVGRQRIAETLAGLTIDEDLELQRRVVVAAETVPTLVAEAGNYDLLLLGGSPQSWRSGRRLDTQSTKVCRNAPNTAMVVLSRHSQPRPWWSRLLGV